jgi:hypothetical protein
MILRSLPSTRTAPFLGLAGGLVVILLLQSSCGGNNNDLRHRIASSVAPLQPGLAFSLIFPNYLPTGVREIPTSTRSGPDNVFMVFPPSPLSSTGRRVDIIERPTPTSTPEPIPSFVSIPSVEVTRILGQDVTLAKRRNGNLECHVSGEQK